MPYFMLHFECPARAQGREPVTAEACAIGDSLDEAEATAREEIDKRGQSAGALIAFAALSEEKIPSLNEQETTLYLKALQQRSGCAVHFIPLR